MVNEIEKKREESKEETEKQEQKTEEKIDAGKKELVDKTKEKKEEKKEETKTKKHEAIARGVSLPISKKQAVYICRFIKNKPIDMAINDLSKVIKFKQAIPFKGEIPHRKGMMSGRYPIKASGYFINLLKALKGNALVNNIDLENTKILSASATWASRPSRTGRRLAKRTNILLKAREFSGGI